MNTQIDSRIGGAPLYYLVPQEDMNMRVPDQILKSVAFIGTRNEAGEPIYRGTAYFISVPGAYGDPSWIFLATAKHIADRVGPNFIVRVNRKDGTPLELDGTGTKWWHHPTDPNGVDAAVTTFGPPIEIGTSLDTSTLALAMFATDATLKKQNIGIGDQVFITGLFAHLQKTSRNLPIVRTGNLAMMPEEKIPFSSQNLEAYLLESRSISGLSGSPVFVRSTMALRGFVDGDKNPTVAFATSGTFYFLGSMIGHWDAPEDGVYVHAEKVNMGISAMVPAKKIAEIINHPELVEMRKKWDKDVIAKQNDGVTSFDSISEGMETPFTQQDFESDLRKVTRRVEPSESDEGTK
jgi:hypothetical protein